MASIVTSSELDSLLGYDDPAKRDFAFVSAYFMLTYIFLLTVQLFVAIFVVCCQSGLTVQALVLGPQSEAVGMSPALYVLDVVVVSHMIIEISSSIFSKGRVHVLWTCRSDAQITYIKNKWRWLDLIVLLFSCIVIILEALIAHGHLTGESLRGSLEVKVLKIIARWLRIPILFKKYGHECSPSLNSLFSMYKEFREYKYRRLAAEREQSKRDM
jgi:hypothetical protein